METFLSDLKKEPGKERKKHLKRKVKTNPWSERKETECTGLLPKSAPVNLWVKANNSSILTLRCGPTHFMFHSSFFFDLPIFFFLIVFSIAKASRGYCFNYQVLAARMHWLTEWTSSPLRLWCIWAKEIYFKFKPRWHLWLCEIPWFSCFLSRGLDVIFSHQRPVSTREVHQLFLVRFWISCSS